MSDVTAQRPTKEAVLRRLKQCGLDVTDVFDVGVMFQTEELRVVYADVRQHLFEPVTNFHDRIVELYDGLDFVLVPKAVGASDGTTTLLQRTLSDDLEVTHSRIETDGARPRQPSEQETTIEAIRLDSYLAGLTPQDRSILLKIDVDGNEPEVLQGATETLQQTTAVIIETQLTNFSERNAFLEDAGFALHDLCDLCYYGGMLTQFDAVYLRKDLTMHTAFNPFAAHEPFDQSIWKKYPPQ